MTEHKGAPLPIWLGILLDGILVSLVIGASLVQGHISYSLIGGLFLSNYPEALSSSIGMRQHGFPFRRSLFMWTSLMVITGIGAAMGNTACTPGGAEWRQHSDHLAEHSPAKTIGLVIVVCTVAIMCRTP